VYEDEKIIKNSLVKKKRVEVKIYYIFIKKIIFLLRLYIFKY